MKEKNKRLKQRLKVWNKEQFGDTFKKFKKLEEELNKLEIDSVNRHLTPLEMETRNHLQEELWRAAQSHEPVSQ